MFKSDSTIPMLRPVFSTDLRFRSKKASGVPFACSDSGVAHPASIAIAGSATVAFDPSSRLPVGLASFAICEPSALPLVGVGQPAKSADRAKQAQPCFVPWIAFCVSERPVASCACGVGQPVSSMSNVRRADARSRENCRPAGVAIGFQVSENKVEPSPASRAFNLFPKDNVRATLANEPLEGGP